MTELLRVTDLGIRQGERTLVSGVSFAVEAGERVGLIGESGSGKSLTALAVLGLLPDGMTATGSIRVGGEEIVGAPDRVLVPLRGSRLAMIGILPSVEARHLTLDYMTPRRRYQALNDRILALRRGRPLTLERLGEIALHQATE